MLYLSWSLIWGGKASGNPWCATGLEWQTASPPPPDNYARTPRVVTSPYQYDPRDGSFVSQDGAHHAGRAEKQ
jgi:cytochrome c oxidase subunit 1